MLSRLDYSDPGKSKDENGRVCLRWGTYVPQLRRGNTSMEIIWNEPDVPAFLLL